ncbi:MAG: YIP1 family protein [Actinomycetota bacterium]|nr:YIP1 family protein [Actinomycetota bacterium]
MSRWNGILRAVPDLIGLFVGAVLHRLLQTVRFERDAYVWMDFNDRATGDGLILVVVTQLLLMLGRGVSVGSLITSLPEVALALLNSIVMWLLYSGIVYAIVRYLFRAEGSFPFYLRLTGFAAPTLLLLIATLLLPVPAIVAVVLGSIWFVAVVAQGTHYVADLPLDRAAIAAVGGFAGVIIVMSILGSLRFF